MAREREYDDGRELPPRQDRDVSDCLESMPSPGGRLSNLSRCFGTMTRSLSFTVTSCNRFWNLEDKNGEKENNKGQTTATAPTLLPLDHKIRKCQLIG